jgi:hypothetical protein
MGGGGDTMDRKETDVYSKLGEAQTNSAELNLNYVPEGTNESGKETGIQ